MDNTLAKQTQFPFFQRNSFNGLLSQTALAQFNLYPYLTNYFPALNRKHFFMNIVIDSYR